MGTPKAPLDLDKIEKSMVFLPSQCCTISCGTVCMDLEQSPPKVVLIYNKKLGIWQLPKGRKNIGEGLQAAALRETMEETGARPMALKMKVATRSTPTIEQRSAGLKESSGGGSSDPNVTTTIANEEAIAAVTYLDLQARTPGTHKIVFFFAATAESADGLNSRGQEAHEKLRPEWVTFEKADELLHFQAEKEVVKKAHADVARAGLLK